MSTNIDPQGAPPPEPPAQPAFDPAPWQDTGILSRDPGEVAQRLQIGDAMYDVDQRDQLLSRVLSSGEQPFLPGGMDMREAAAILREYTEMRDQGLIGDPNQGYQQQQQGYQQQDGGWLEEPQQPAFDQQQLVNLVGQVVAHQMNTWQQQQMQQAAEQQRQQVITSAVTDIATQNGYPDAIRDAIMRETTEVLRTNPLATPQQAAQAAAGRWQAQLAAYMTGMGNTPPPPMPTGGQPLPPGGVPPAPPRSIQEVRERAIAAARAAGQG